MSVEKYYDNEKRSYCNFRFNDLESFQHHDQDVNSLIWMPPYIVSCSHDRHISIFDYYEQKLVAKFSGFKAWVNHLCMWNENTFFAGSSDNSVKGFTFDGKREKLVFSVEMSASVGRLVKVDETFLCCNLFRGGLGILNVKKKRIERILEVGFSIGWYQDLILSKVYDRIVYVAAGYAAKVGAKGVSVDTGIGTVSFKLNGGGVRSIATTRNSSGEELVFLGTDSVYYFHGKSGEVLGRFDSNFLVQSLRMVNGCFLFVGGGSGNLRMYNIDSTGDKVKAKVVLSTKCKYNKSSFLIYDTVIIDKERKKWKFAVCGTTSGYLIREFQFEFDDCSEEDMKERILFVREEKETYFGNGLKHFQIKVKIDSGGFEVPKVLLY